MKNIFTISLLLALALFVSTDVRANHDATGASTETHTETSTTATGGTSSTQGGGTSGSTGTTGTAGGTAAVEIQTTSLPIEVKAETKTEIKMETAVPPVRMTCGDKEKPTLSCPAGYMVGCSATGGDHWGCIKDPSASASVNTGAGAAAGTRTDYLDQDSDDDGVTTILEDDSVKSAIYIKLGDVKGESEDDKKAGAAMDSGFKNGDVPTQADFSVMIDSRKVRGWDPKTKEEVAAEAPKTADSVKTAEDLALFAAVQVEDDTSLESVSFNYGKIIVKYSADAKLFGFIPMKFGQEVTLDDANVSVKLPWYSFLLSGYVTLDDLKATAEAKKKDKPMQIESWSFGASNSGSMNTGNSAGKVNVAVGDVNGDGITQTAADVAVSFSVLSDVMKASYDLKANKKI